MCEYKTNFTQVLFFTKADGGVKVVEQLHSVIVRF